MDGAQLVLCHDLGKVLCLFGEPQWAVVGDTFPTGCVYSNRVVWSEFFALNPDMKRPELQTKHGVYAPGCGPRRRADELGPRRVLYHHMKPHLPLEGLYMIRYHSFYAWQPARTNTSTSATRRTTDEALGAALQPIRPLPKNRNCRALKPYYEDLLARYFAGELRF